MILRYPSSILLGGMVIVTALGGCADPRTPELVSPQRAYIDATTVLRQAADDPDPVTRANAIEGLSQTQGLDAGGIYKQALGDEYPTVRFAAAMAIGDVRYEPARDTLIGMAKREPESDQAEPDKRVFCAVIYALHRLGDTTFTSQLAELLSDQEKEVRADAAMVLGKLGEESATVPLSVQLEYEQDPSVQLQIVESLALLGDRQNALRLEAHTKTSYLEDRLVAIGAMQRVGSRRSVPVLRALLNRRQPPRVRVAAAGALARLGYIDQGGYEFSLRSAKRPRVVIKESFRDDREIFEVEALSLQRLAAMSLGWMRRQEARGALHSLLSSEDGPVRVAAAMSLLRLLKAYRPSGLAGKSPGKAPIPTSRATSRPEVRTPAQLELHTAGGKD